MSILQSIFKVLLKGGQNKTTANDLRVQLVAIEHAILTLEDKVEKIEEKLNKID